MADSMRLCERCGAPWIDIAELADAALVSVDSLAKMKLAVPDIHKRAVVKLARALPCHASICVREEK